MTQAEEYVRLDRSMNRMLKLPKVEFDKDEYNRLEERQMELHVKLKQRYGTAGSLERIRKAEEKLDQK
jgi:tetrahydromethanopterin S-methyltransferase subunit G